MKRIIVLRAFYNCWQLIVLDRKSGMLDDDIPNIEKPRPDVWRGRPLYEFIEDCWNNSIAVAGNKNVIANRLALVDQIFEDFHKVIKPKDISQLVPALLLLRSFSAYRASAMVGLSLPTDGYALQRSCLENAGYARLIADDASLSERWLKRDDDENTKSFVRKTFTQAAVRNSIGAKSQKLAVLYQRMYERVIEFGAHPNEKSVTTSLIKESLKTKAIQFKLLTGDGPALDHSLRMTAHVGLCALERFFRLSLSSLIFLRK